MELTQQIIYREANSIQLYKRQLYRVVSVFLVCGVIGVAIPAYFLYGKQRFCDCECTSLEFRIDCLPTIRWSQQTKEQCDSNTCCWHFLNDSRIPPCFHRHPTETEYYVVTYSNSSFVLAQLRKNVSSSAYSSVNMEIESFNDHHLRVSLNSKEVLDYPIFNENSELQKGSKFVNIPKKGERLYVKVRRGNGRKLFDTSFGPLIYRENYIEFSTYLPSYNLYGLGQAQRRRFGFGFTETEKWVLYSRFRSNANQSDHFAGVHPFYLCLESNGEAHGVFLETTHPFEVTLTAGPLLTFRIVGGALNLHFFIGPSPSGVIRQLQSYVGKPALPPYWALGHHVCNSVTLSDAKKRVDELRNRSVSQESDCGSSLMYQQGLFENNDSLSEFFAFLDGKDQKGLILLTPHIPYVNSIENTDYSHSPCRGELFGKDIIGYIDFFNKKISGSMEKQLSATNFSAYGVLLEYNTPLNTNENMTKFCAKPPFKFLPGGNSLSAWTACWNCIHGDTFHYKIHNMYGHKNLETVRNAAKVSEVSKNKRPFILSLSTFLGSGKYGGSWGGPNKASWADLKQAVADMIEYSANGIPMTGEPYCGYYGNFDQDLCSRWLQVASLSPLTIGYRGPGENPVNLVDNGLVSSVGKMAIRLKYSLLPYLYSLFYKANLYGDTVVRPLFFEFPKDSKTYHLDSQYMWGPSLLISPVLTPKTQRINVYFPKGCWYDYHDGALYHIESGKHVLLPAIESHINMHVRGGHIIPGRMAALTTADSLRKSFTLTVALNCSKVTDPCYEDGVLARGDVFIDDGITEGGHYAIVNIEVSNRTLSARSNKKLSVPNKLELIRLFGIRRKPSKIMINGKTVGHATTEYSVQYDSLSIKPRDLNLLTDFVIRWEYDICTY